MDALILKLPRTEAGKALLRLCVKVSSGWDFPDDTNAADIDWDKAAVEAERDNEAYERWLAEQGRV